MLFFTWKKLETLNLSRLVGSCDRKRTLRRSTRTGTGTCCRGETVAGLCEDQGVQQGRRLCPDRATGRGGAGQGTGCCLAAHPALLPALGHRKQQQDLCQVAQDADWAAMGQGSIRNKPHCPLSLCSSQEPHFLSVFTIPHHRRGHVCLMLLLEDGVESAEQPVSWCL